MMEEGRGVEPPTRRTLRFSRPVAGPPGSTFRLMSYRGMTSLALVRRPGLEPGSAGLKVRCSIAIELATHDWLERLDYAVRPCTAPCGQSLKRRCALLPAMLYEPGSVGFGGRCSDIKLAAHNWLAAGVHPNAPGVWGEPTQPEGCTN